MIVQKFFFLANKYALPHSYKITPKNLALAKFTGCTGKPRSPIEFLPLNLEIILRLQAARKHIQFLIIKNMNVNASDN